jgi:hypothetical protein
MRRTANKPQTGRTCGRRMRTDKATTWLLSCPSAPSWGVGCGHCGRTRQCPRPSAPPKALFVPDQALVCGSEAPVFR